MGTIEPTTTDNLTQAPVVEETATTTEGTETVEVPAKDGEINFENNPDTDKVIAPEPEATE